MARTSAQHFPSVSGIVTLFRVPPCRHLLLDWVEGVAIMIAALLMVIVASFGDWQQERHFHELIDKAGHCVKVVRDVKLGYGSIDK